MRKEEIHLGPWHRSLRWTGELCFVDDCSTHDFSYDDVTDVIACSQSRANDLRGSIAAVVKLKDGRYAAWETSWGPIGHGFSEGRYGRAADVIVANSLRKLFFSLSERSRHKLIEELGL